MNGFLSAAIDRALDAIFEAEPLQATFVGDHRFDERLAPQSPEGRGAARAGLEEARAAVAAVGREGLSEAEDVDRELVLDDLDVRLRWESDVRPASRNPGLVLDDVTFGVYLLLQRDFAPLPERLHRIARRLAAVPATLADARHSLADPGEIPCAWAETAAEVARGLPALLGDDLPARGRGTVVEAELQSAGHAAAEALEAYARDVAERIVPNARGEFAIGRPLFDFLLATKHRLDLDADSLLALGKREVAEVGQEMTSLAGKLARGKTWREVVDACKESHPTPEEVVAAYAREMVRAREFVRERNLVGFPPGERLDVVETPPFARPFMPYAAYISPAPFEEEQKGIFWVTPVDPDASEERRRQQLRDHCFFEIEGVALHEGYPGHHLQLSLANRIESKVRKVLWSTVFAEGWALYCEQMMGEQGFYSDPRVKLLQLKARLWRAWRVVVDHGLHVGGLSFDDAVATMMREADLEEVNAIREVRRYTASPTQPMSYTVGRRQIMDLLRDYRRERPEASLRRFHDELLSHGTIPFVFVRRLMGLPGGESGARTTARPLAGPSGHG